MAVKTDNSNPQAKLDLRRYFLRKYHTESPPRVLDCCQGEGLVWTTLTGEFLLASYWAIDLKKRKGRLSLDSALVLRQPGWPQDVIDVDTWGSPWKHWQALLPNVSRPTTVFLTIGVIHPGGAGGLDRIALKALGLHKLRIPEGITAKLHHVAAGHLLAQALDHGLTLIEAIEAASSGHARYIGVHLQP